MTSPELQKMMSVDDRIFGPGRILLGLGVCSFGTMYLIFGRFAGGLFLAQDWTPSAPAFAYLFGLVLIAAGAMIVVPKTSGPAALFFGILTCGLVVLLNYTHFEVVAANGSERTRAFEPLAVGAAALVLASALRGDGSRHPTLAVTGRYLFAVSMIVFGLQHYMYSAYIASLIPSWFPARLAFAYITGTAFIASGIAIAVNVQARLAGILLGVMFLVFVGVVQAPLVVAMPSHGFLWASLFVPLALCGCAWIVASAPGGEAVR